MEFLSLLKFNLIPPLAEKSPPGSVRRVFKMLVVHIFYEQTLLIVENPSILTTLLRIPGFHFGRRLFSYFSMIMRLYILGSMFELSFVCS